MGLDKTSEDFKQATNEEQKDICKDIRTANGLRYTSFCLTIILHKRNAPSKVIF